MSLTSLPDDCILQVLVLSQTLDILSLRQTCRRFNHISRMQATWRYVLERVSSEGRIPYMVPKELEASAEDLERLCARFYRLKWQIRNNDTAVQELQEHRWVAPPVRNPAELPVPHELRLWPLHEEKEEWYRTGTWISPGFLIMGSLVRPRDDMEKEYGYLSVFDSGRDLASIIPGTPPVSEYKIPEFPGSAAELTLSKGPIEGEKNTYLVLVGAWTSTQWALLKLRLPWEAQPADFQQIATLRAPRFARSTASDIEGDYVALLSDTSGALCSIFLWNWRDATCVRFKVASAHDRKATGPEDGSSPILIVPPYIVFIHTHPFVIHVLRIPTSFLAPLDTYDLNARPRLSNPSWSARLPWERTQIKPDIRLAALRNGVNIERGPNNAVVVNIDVCMGQRHGSAKLVISNGQSQQAIRNQMFNFDFSPEICDVKNVPNTDLIMGVTSIPGSTGWLTPHELDVLLRRLIRLRGEPDTQHDNTEEPERRILVSRAELRTRVAIDPVLGRFCVLPDGYPGLYLVDMYKK